MLRTSSATWAASRVRPSYIVSRIVDTRRSGFRCCLTRSTVLQQLAQTLQRVVLAWIGMSSSSAPVSALTVSRPSDGGQSINT